MGSLSTELLLVGIILLAFACSLPTIWIIKSAAESRKLVIANNALSDFFMQRIRSLRLVNLAGSDEFERRLVANKTYQIQKSFIRNARLQFKTEKFDRAYGYRISARFTLRGETNPRDRLGYGWFILGTDGQNSSTFQGPSFELPKN